MGVSVLSVLITWLLSLAFIPMQASAQPSNLDDYVISDGAPITIEDKGFTMTPPDGWEVHRNYPNTTLLLQAPDNPRLRYRRTIQVMSFSGPQYIDELSAEKFSDVIVRKFSSAAQGLSGYRVRNYLPVELESGLDGYLYYAEFKVNNVDLMQMHILVSSATRHFLMTFTDLAEYFDTENAPQDHLNEAWVSLGSVRLDSVGPSRFALPVTIVLSIFGLLFLFWAIRWFAGRLARREYRDFADGKYDPDDDVIVTNSPETLKTAVPIDIEEINQEGTVHEDDGFDDDDDDNSDDVITKKGRAL